MYIFQGMSHVGTNLMKLTSHELFAGEIRTPVEPTLFFFDLAAAIRPLMVDSCVFLFVFIVAIITSHKKVALNCCCASRESAPDTHCNHARGDVCFITFLRCSVFPRLTRLPFPCNLGLAKCLGAASSSC